MARELWGVEKGVKIYDVNSDANSDILAGQGAPGGDADAQDDASVGSIYQDRTNGFLYIKNEAGSGADKWIKIADISDTNNLGPRGQLKVATNDAIVAGSRDLVASPFADDDGTTLAAADFTIGDVVLGDADGTPALFEVTAISAPSVTFAAYTPALASGDFFLVEYYLPDPKDSQENAAVVHYTTDLGVAKTGDIDWQVANGINLSSGYASQNGNVAAGDDVELAISKLDGNQIDLTTLSGVAQGAEDLGTFTGDTIQDNRTNKEALQDLETALEDIEAQISDDAITTQTTVDSVLVDDCAAVEWEVYAREAASPANVQAFKVFATHDGTDSADASNVDDTLFAKLKIGSNFDLDIDVELSGTGASQEIQLNITSTDGVDIRVRRNCINF